MTSRDTDRISLEKELDLLPLGLHDVLEQLVVAVAALGAPRTVAHVDGKPEGLNFKRKVYSIQYFTLLANKYDLHDRIRSIRLSVQ